MLVQENYRKIRTNQERKRRRISENTRINLVLAGLFALFVVVFARVVYFQWSEVSKWEAHGNSIYYRKVPIIAERGRILDRNGVILAMNEPRRNIILDPYQLPKFDLEKRKVQNKPALLARVKQNEQDFYRHLDQLADWLGETREELYAQFNYRNYEGKPKGDRYLKRKIDKLVADKVKALHLPGIKIAPVAARRYPDGSLFAQIVGVTKVDVDLQNNERIIGLEGLEYQFDRYLRGKNGLRVMVQDNTGRYIDNVSSDKNTAVQDGRDLVLSIDKNIQSATMDVLRETVQAHQATSGSAVVLDAKTGEVLAMVNYPDFNPSQFTKYDVKLRRNYAVNDLMEPGSLFKPLVIAKALDEGKVKPDTWINTNPYVVQNHRIEDVGSHAQLTVTGIITKSSNVGSSKVMALLDSKDVFDYLVSIGVGRKPNSGFPGEAAGILHNWKQWKPLDKATLSYGYGVQMSLLQLARAYTIFTNNGQLLTPTFLKLGQNAPRTIPVIKPTTAKWMRSIMTTVTEPGGTGTRAAIPGFKVAGKSGTARKLIHGRYSSNDHVAMFAGYAPAENPRLIVVVGIDSPRVDGYYGGVVAAPAFGQIMASALSILGEIPSEPVTAAKKQP
ncbi:MAG: penicillin-binding protein 2 [Neisseriaceae bacterium]